MKNNYKNENSRDKEEEEKRKRERGKEKGGKIKKTKDSKIIPDILFHTNIFS